MPLLQRLPGFSRSPSGLEWRLWRRLPAIGLWGTLVPLALAGLAHLFSPEDLAAGAARQRLMWDYILVGVVVLHWTLLLTVAIGCVIVMLMKGPAYVADAYPLAERDDAPGGPGGAGVRGRSGPPAG